MSEYTVWYWDDSLGTKEIVWRCSTIEEAEDFISRQDAPEMYYIRKIL